MAKYIEKTSVIQARPETLYEDVESENGDEKETLRKQSYNKGWNSCIKIYLEDIEQIPTADVVERCKIDKAIEEIEKQNPELFGYENQKATQFFLEKQTVIEIIKRNIGE